MATTLEELERRITRIEQELARLQRLVEQPSQTEMPAQRGVQLLHEAQWHIFLCGEGEYHASRVSCRARQRGGGAA